MPATTIMLIRHAEKPDGNDSGVDPKGNPDKHDLIVRGWQRAGASPITRRYCWTG